MTAWRRARFAATLLLALAVSGVGVGIGPGNPPLASAGTGPSPAAGTSVFRPLNPTRLVDTRASTRLLADAEMTMPVAGHAGIPDGATAVMVNVTAIDASAAGFVTAFPSGTARPLTSALNVGHGGHTVANLAMIPLGADGAVVIYSSVAMDLAVDAFGYFVEAASSTGGRFIAIAPRRAFDSRAGSGLVAPGQTVHVDVGDAVPPDAMAVAATLTVTEATAPGFWTAWPAGTDRPETSNVNITGPGQTVANQVVVPIAGAAMDVYANAGGHVIVDVTGYFTGPSAPASTAGLFVPSAPQRLLDTRDASGTVGRARAGATIEVPTAPHAAIVANLTVVDASQAGFVTAYAAGTPRPATSSVNVQQAEQTVATDVIVGVSDRGLALYVEPGADVLVDLSGYFTGLPAIATLAPAAPEPVVPTPVALSPDRLVVPAAGIDVAIGFGVDAGTLAVSPGFWPDYGWLGQPGNVVIGGHRTTHGAPFRHLDVIQPGDDLWLYAKGTVFHYVATEHFIVHPSQVQLVVRQTTARELTLFACHPPGSEAQRYVVRAVQAAGGQ